MYKDNVAIITGPLACFSLLYLGFANVIVELHSSTAISFVAPSRKGRNWFVDHQPQPPKRDFTICKQVTQGGAVKPCWHRALNLQACEDAGPIRWLIYLLHLSVYRWQHTSEMNEVIAAADRFPIGKREAGGGGAWQRTRWKTEEDLWQRWDSSATDTRSLAALTAGPRLLQFHSPAHLPHRRLLLTSQQ